MKNPEGTTRLTTRSKKRKTVPEAERYDIKKIQEGIAEAKRLTNLGEHEIRKQGRQKVETVSAKGKASHWLTTLCTTKNPRRSNSDVSSWLTMNEVMASDSPREKKQRGRCGDQKVRS